jgi:hypothetical protein
VEQKQRGFVFSGSKCYSTTSILIQKTTTPQIQSQSLNFQLWTDDFSTKIAKTARSSLAF